MKTLQTFLLCTVGTTALLFFTQALALADSAPVDPSVDPAGALDQFWAAVTGRKWGLVAVIGTMLFVAFARFIAPRIHGKFGTWVNSTRVSAMLALVSGGGAAVATQLMKGGHLTPKLLVYGFTIGVGAIGGYNVFWDLFFPADKKKPPSTTADSAADLAKKTPPAAPPPIRPGMLLPFLFIGFAFAAMGCNVCTSAGTSPTCARKVLTGIDALDGAAARISRRWVQKCGDGARALRDAGKLADADKAYTQCETTGGKMVQIVTATEDSTQTASDAVDVGEAAGQKDYSGILQPVLSFVNDLKKVFADAGVSIPNIQLPGVN